MRSFERETTGAIPGPANDWRADPDARLIAEVADGNMQAAAELIERHSDRIYAIGFRMLGEAQAAEDLVQDIFLKIWKNAKTWEPGRALFSTWLHRVAVNLCYDKMRKRKETSVEEMPGGIDERPGGEPDSYAKLESKAASLRIRNTVASLPERQAAAITLCHLEGYTNIETAEILETTVEAVESLLSRGRRKLRQLLGDEKRELIGGK